MIEQEFYVICKNITRYTIKKNSMPKCIFKWMNEQINVHSIKIINNITKLVEMNK